MISTVNGFVIPKINRIHEVNYHNSFDVDYGGNQTETLCFETKKEAEKKRETLLNAISEFYEAMLQRGG